MIEGRSGAETFLSLDLTVYGREICYCLRKNLEESQQDAVTSMHGNFLYNHQKDPAFPYKISHISVLCEIYQAYYN